ncbi:(2,3-dihydroxybenzoyl)adenylate synthase [Pseudonocardia sp. N23]|uniref:(2,3-dihydroxybenzoyl)adenylate synthase n=1 Tax=Pseudonocardia sp. N23 TaxID=1987376 RepID=UPI000BFD6052|nr:AMP-binding protein [Pseudonocardia sp. N23]GAY08789.1 2,3-dihydroxybenzoate-AMP ligase [Pseudonocardia sp. N23]
MSDLAVGFTPWPSELAARYREAGYWRGETLGELLRTWAASHRDALAVVDGELRLSYAELDKRVDERAAGLVALGIGAGDRLVLQLPNTAELVVLTFALARIGAVPVMALPAHRRTEIEHLAALSEAVGYVVADSFQGFDHRTLAAEIVELVPGIEHVLVDGDPGPFTALGSVTAPAAAETPFVDPAGIAVLLISGGTTGKPKLIPRTHDDYALNARASAEVCALTADDRYLVALPAAHNFPLACPGILGVLGVGGTVVMCPAPSPDVALPLIERERITVTALVPPLARLWAEAAPYAGADLSSLRLLQVGGAKLDAALARRIPDALGAQVQQVFGMAEGLLNYTRLDDPAEIVEISQGRPLCADDEIRVVDPDGNDVEVGELLTRGPYTLQGYYRVPEYNATAFTPDGWYRSGDVVRVLPSGHLVVEGRVKDVINRGGENVSAGELEEYLLVHPAVAAAAVVGLPDETLGEIVCAVVVPGPDGPPKLKALKAFLGEQGLARFKHPDRLVIVDELPLTAVGKISKRDVVERLST